MIERYTLPEMKAIWELQNKYDTWLKVELAIVEAQAEIGRIPREAADQIVAKATFTLERALEIERTTRHDLLGFVGAVLENLGEEGRYFHYGVTSYDVEDPALSLLMCEAIDLLLDDCERLIAAIRKRASEHKHTPMIGRTHGIHAEPITLGFKLALWLDEVQRNAQRLRQAREAVGVGKVSGAVGTYANIDPRVEEIVCRKLGLQPAPISSQIVSRDRHAQLLTTLAILSTSLEKFATEIRNLQRTEIRELEEAFAKGQRGSSAMPHKRNPWVSEQVSGLARVVRGYVVPALENIVTWHERDLANSSVERVIIPDACCVVDYQLNTFTRIVEEFGVFPEAMAANLNRMGGIVFSQQAMLALVEKGLSREEAYNIVQKHAAGAWAGGSFRDLLSSDPQVRELLSPGEIAACFDIQYHLKHLDQTFARLGIE